MGASISTGSELTATDTRCDRTYIGTEFHQFMRRHTVNEVLIFFAVLRCIHGHFGALLTRRGWQERSMVGGRIKRRSEHLLSRDRSVTRSCIKADLWTDTFPKRNVSALHPRATHSVNVSRLHFMCLIPLCMYPPYLVYTHSSPLFA